jgi:hypothetical protein
VARPTAEARAKHFITTAESLEEKYSMRGVGDYGGGPQNMLRSLQSRHERLLQPALPPPTCLAGANPTLSPFAWKTKFKSKPFGGGAGVCGERCILREAALERLGAGANNQDFGLTTGCPCLCRMDLNAAGSTPFDGATHLGLWVPGCVDQSTHGPRETSFARDFPQQRTRRSSGPAAEVGALTLQTIR